MTSGPSEVRCSCGGANPAKARFCSWCGARLWGSGRALTSERRTVTALFADLSNFSRLVATVDAEVLLDVVDPVLGALGAIVEQHGGMIEKFAGDALLALFGAPVAHEEDASRAVHAAEDMHAYLARTEVRPLSEPLSLHIGVATGPVVARTIGTPGRRDYAVLGDAVVLAQRLQAGASAGSTFVDAATADLVRGAFALEPLGELPIKGRTHPVPAFRVIGTRRPSATLLRRLVGREHELGDLMGTLTQAAEGRAVLRAITGPPGYGKSQLLAHLGRDAESRGYEVVELVAPAFAGQPYGALRPLIERALSSSDGTAPIPALASILLGDTDAQHPTLSDRTPAGLRQELQTAAVAWWRDLAGRRPLLVTVDNAQWLDAPSAGVIDAFVSGSGSPAMICVAGRHVDGLSVAPEDQIELTPLSRAAVIELVAEELGLKPADSLVGVVEQRAAGNPMAVRESTRQLVADGLLDVHHGHARLVSGATPSTAPAALASLLAARIDALPPNVVNLATTAAVIGTAPSIPLLEAVSGVSTGDLESAARNLVSAGLATVADGTLRFETPLVRDVLYARLTTRRRRELHARVAVVAQGDSASPLSLVAEHLYSAGDAAQALPALRQLAARTRRLFDHDAAALALTRAVQSARSASPELVPELLCELGEVRVECGEYATAAEAFAEARVLANDARAWSGEAGALRRAGDYGGALALLEQALSDRPAGDVRLVWCELAWAHSVAGHLEQSRTAADRGLALRAGDDEVSARLLLQRVRVSTLLGELDAATDDAQRAVTILEGADDTGGLCTALRLLGDLQHQRGELAQAAETLERGMATAERAGLIEEVGGCLINLGLVHGEQDDHAAASAAYARAAVVFEQAGHTAGCATAYGNRSYELLMLGDVEDARVLGQQALELAEGLGHQLAVADVQHTLGLIAEQVDDPVTARRHAQAAIDAFSAAGMPRAAGPSRELAARVAPAAPAL